MALVTCPCGFRPRRLAQSVFPGLGTAYVCSYVLLYVCSPMCAFLCVLSYVCSYMCAILCVLSYLCSPMCSYMCALIYVLSYVCSPLCSHMCALICMLAYVCSPMCALLCVLSYVCSHMCACPVAFRLRRLAQNAGPGKGSGIFPGNYRTTLSCEASMCVLAFKFP